MKANELQINNFLQASHRMTSFFHHKMVMFRQMKDTYYHKG